MSKRIRNSEMCADCSVPDPRWASINRGVLICDECCSVHRSLGRHSSQVRHLMHTQWPPTQLQMVQTLYNNGANSIWEHSLLDPASVMSGKRKANPQDKVHPNKAEFIRAKYQMLAFVHRMPCRDDDSITSRDLSKQLHSSVRTGNLETCLRLLSLGAQANFFHPEKGNTPLHVAAKAGQVSQAELLSVYGADPGAPDSSGITPIDYARQAGHHDLADRLVEIQYELTDRLAFYLCGRKADHRNGQHFIIPQMADSSQDLSELAKAAKKKLQSLSNHLFEELAMDVYDEVDRRETDAVWLATQNHSTLVTETTVVPFLPVNPEYSSTRNQGRQKLARFNAHEFATLVIDILSDSKRRQQGTSVKSPKESVELILKGVDSRHGSESQDNDQPDYDSVASDDDTDLDQGTRHKDSRAKSLDSDPSDSPISVQEFLEVKNALTASESRIQQLLKVNSNLSDELRQMQKKLQSLQSENSSLRRQGPTQICPSSDPKRRPSTRVSRPISMYETGSSLKPSLPKGETPYPEEVAPTPQTFFPHASKMEKQTSDYDNNMNDEQEENGAGWKVGRLRSSGWQGEEGYVLEQEDVEAELDPMLPSTEDVIRKTEQITKNIQELLRAAQENKYDRPPERECVRVLRHSLGCFSALVPWAEKGSASCSPIRPLVLSAPSPTSCFIPCSERIHMAVAEMADLFPKKPRLDAVRGSLRLLTFSAHRLQGECKKALVPNSGPTHDMQLVTQQVIQCAYDIAKAAKQLVTITTKENCN
ncbi:ARF GTPase-activating protein GIT2a isoform X3 [Denticeps clupeoides]|uniref:ARF GTPase-activating protein GIT2a isoform X3 n=1 Tax=Denticeps clupeoides TaxID=299321 RepID=UPI0010A33F54|nr:ARF GTPase-activating protein GIT2 isoform X3 [Denticeps clupeoides]